MIRFFKTPIFQKLWYPNLIWKGKSESDIYLTFDDGPHIESTSWTLDQLRKIKAEATFFCIGKNLIQYPGLALRIIDEGHQLANHTFTHLNGWRSGEKEYSNDVNECDQAMLKLGIDTDLFRPPYGRIRSSQIRALRDKRIVMWSHLAWDFDEKLDAVKCINRLKSAQGGSIIVFHNNAKSFGNLKRVLPVLMDHYLSQGFELKALT